MTVCMQTKPVPNSVRYGQEQEICRICTVGPLPGGTEAGSVILLSISLHETEEQIFLLLVSCVMDAAAAFEHNQHARGPEFRSLQQCCWGFKFAFCDAVWLGERFQTFRRHFHLSKRPTQRHIPGDVTLSWQNKCIYWCSKFWCTFHQPVAPVSQTVLGCGERSTSVPSHLAPEPRTEGWVWLRAGLDVFEKRKISFLSVVEPRIV